MKSHSNKSLLNRDLGEKSRVSQDLNREKESEGATAISDRNPDSNNTHTFCVVYSYKGSKSRFFDIEAESLQEAEAWLEAVKATAHIDRGHYGVSPEKAAGIVSDNNSSLSNG